MDDILLARYIGITKQELERMPVYDIEQYRVVRAAEMKAKAAAHERQARGRG